MREYHISNKIRAILKHKFKGNQMRFEIISSLLQNKSIDEETIVKVELYEQDQKYYEYEVSGLAIEQDSETGQKYLLMRVDA